MQNSVTAQEGRYAPAPWIRTFIRCVFLSLMSVALLSCGTPVNLVQSPKILQVEARYPAEEVPPSLRTTEATIFYMTDRMPVVSDGNVNGYSFERSSSMAFGETWVEFGENLGWEALVAQTAIGQGPPLSLENLGYKERIRFEQTPIRHSYDAGRLNVETPQALKYKNEIARFRTAIAGELAETGQSEAIVFIHGFNTDFEDALATTAALWHYSGRSGLPISYSWPAGNPGLFKYFKDRESGEFSLFHLKEFLRALAAVPELKKVHIIGHSRGADVLTSALRELILVETALGRNPRQSLKIETLILAAPDLDFDVAQQRLIAEHTLTSFGQTTVYLNPKDNALGLAQHLATGTRFGRLAVDDLNDSEIAFYAGLRNVNFINVEQAGGQLGHSYFRRNPAVFSDIILTMRTSSLPGSDARPLENVEGNFWTMHADYPAKRAPDLQPMGKP